MPNLLSKQPLTEAKALAEVYVVWDNQDYRMTLETLVSLVTKVSLGLGNVNNTPDSEKPISNPVAAALLQKANTEDVVSNATFQTFIDSLQGYVTTEQLNTAINEVKAIIDQVNSLTPAEVSEMINTALTPVNDSLTQMLSQLEAQALQISTINTELEKKVNQTSLTEQLSQFEGSIGTQITQLSNNFSQSLQAMGEANASEITRLETAATQQASLVNQQIQQIVGQIDSVTQLIQTLQANFANHTHAASDITGLQEMVEEMVGEMVGDIEPPGCNIVIGEEEW